MMMKKISIVAFAASVLASCGVKNPNLVGVTKPVEQPSPVVSTSTSKSLFFPFVSSDNAFTQDQALTNETSVYVQVARQGTSIKNLNKQDFVLTENGKPVKNFSFSIQDTKAEQVVDIAFVVDVTGSMTPFIESAKVRLTEFIKSTRKKGYHTRMCLSTFGDYTVQKCEKFYDNDPKDTVGAQTQELISELTKLRALKGDLDPGGKDIPENSMQALIDAAKSSWRSDAQKFVILVTDADFLYSPDKLGSLEATNGVLPPNMADVHKALEESQVTVMAVTPNLPGYTSSLQDLSSIVEKTNGEHFLFKSVIKKPAMLDDILNRIISRMESTYKLTYDAEEFDQNHSTLPLDQRQVQVQLKDSKTGLIKDVKTTAKYPDGRPQYKTDWKLADKEIDANGLVVTVDGKELKQSQDYKVVGDTLQFVKPPPPESKVKALYYYTDHYANLRLQPISLSQNLNEKTLKVTLNGVEARKQDIQMARDSANNISITLLPSVAKDNYYKIGEYRGIAVTVQ